MARQQNIGASEKWFIGEDKTLAFTIYQSDESTLQTVTGWALAFYLREQIESDKKVLTCTTGASTITILVSVVSVIIADTDTDNLKPGKYQYWLWRTDAGNETVLAHGDIELLLARQ